MIAGETETIISREGGADHYDNFLFFGKGKKNSKKKKQLTAEELEAKKTRRQAFWSNLGSGFQQGGTVGNILGLFGGGSGGTPTSEDFQVGVGDQLGGSNQAPDSNAKGIPTGVFIVGGIIVLAGGYALYNAWKKKQQEPILQTTTS